MKYTERVQVGSIGTLVGAVVLLGLLCGPALIGAAWRNAGMLALRDALLAQADSAPGTYPLLAVLDESAATARAMRSLRRGMAVDQDGPHGRWALGRAALATGEPQMAAGVLKPLVGDVGRNPLLYHDVLAALSRGGGPEEVVALYELAPPLYRDQVISDTVALAYLDLATGRQGDEETRGQGDGETGRQGEVGQWLERALVLRPGDLYVHYYLWKQAQGAGETEAVAAYREALTDFSPGAIHPADERLVDYAAAVMPALLKDELWSREKMLNVVSFLVWQHSEAAGAERLLERLEEYYPAEPDWPFYLAELYCCRGDLERAEAAYRRALEIAPDYAQAYLRIGMLYETRAEEQAVESLLAE